jgi:hypothetical protein
LIKEGRELVHLPVTASQRTEQLPAQWMRGQTQKLRGGHVATLHKADLM